MSRTRRALAVGAAAIALVVSGCATGPISGPPPIVERNDDGAAPPKPAGPPPMEVPTKDLSWRTCGPSVLGQYRDALPSASEISLECADFTANAVPGNDTDTLRVGAIRATTRQTPDKAPPLVLTTGSDMPSTRLLLTLASSRGKALLDSQPIVAIDRRGTGASSPLDCMTRIERTVLRAGGVASDSTDKDARVKALSDAARTAADGCNDTLSPFQTAFTAKNAAADIDTLRRLWGISRVGILGVGEGSDVALAYASQFPDNTARLVLDSPTAYGTSAKERARQSAEGTNAAIAGFVEQCQALGCALPNPDASLKELLAKASRNQLSDLSDTDVIAAVTTTLALGTNREETIRDLAAMLNDAKSGRTSGLATAVAAAHDLRDSDGGLLNRCNDISEPIGSNDAVSAVDQWSRQFPYTGAVAGYNLLRCASWPATSPPPEVTSLPVPVLILDTPLDPINGNKGMSGLRSLMIKANVTSATTSWQGLGYSAAAHSDCISPIITGYLNSGDPGDTGACPA